LLRHHGLKLEARSADSGGGDCCRAWTETKSTASFRSTAAVDKFTVSFFSLGDAPRPDPSKGPFTLFNALGVGEGQIFCYIVL